MFSSFFSPRLERVAPTEKSANSRKRIVYQIVSSLLVIVLLLLLFCIPFILTNRHLSVNAQWLWLGGVLAGCFGVVALLDRISQ
jgi:pheromone shutdown protein TraB